MPREQVRSVIRSVPGVCAGRLPDPTGQVRAFSDMIGLVALSHIRQSFTEKAAGGSGADGKAWTPLKAATIRARRSGKGTGQVQILRDTGILLSSLSPGGTGNIMDILPGSITLGTNCPYAVHHHEGTAKIPARPLWPDPRDWPESWWLDIGEQARAGIARLVAALIGGG
jgi:hypothetical protein